MRGPRLLPRAWGRTQYCVLHYPDEDKKDDFKEILEKKLDQKDYDFRHTVFPDGTSDFAGRVFNAYTNFNEVIFLGNADFRDAQFSGERTYFRNAQFSGEWTDFSSAQFTGEITDFSGAQFSRESSFEEATFKEVNFDGACYEKEANFNRVTFEGLAYFFESTFKEQVHFSGSS